MLAGRAKEIRDGLHWLRGLHDDKIMADEIMRVLDSLNAGMSGKSYAGIYIFTVSQLRQSGIGIPAFGPVRYHWSRISPAVSSYC